MNQTFQENLQDFRLLVFALTWFYDSLFLLNQKYQIQQHFFPFLSSFILYKVTKLETQSLFLKLLFQDSTCRKSKDLILKINFIDLRNLLFLYLISRWEPQDTNIQVCSFQYVLPLKIQKRIQNLSTKVTLTLCFHKLSICYLVWCQHV